MSKWKRYVKAHVMQARRLYINLFHAFSAADLTISLDAVGIRAGDVVMVHSSFDAFHGFVGKPTHVIEALQKAVGISGAIMMPTLPFTGTAVAYARSNVVFDVRRTPSRVGLITEIFRRSSGVVRSVHPTHPVAVWGRDASALVEDHHLVQTPCGDGSPYMRLLLRRGKILLVGTDIGVLTFYHTIEELLESQLPFSPFTSQIYRLQSRDYEGNTITTQTRLFEPDVSRRRNLAKLESELRRNSAWREHRIGQLRIIALGAEDILFAVAAMSNRGEFCYD